MQRIRPLIFGVILICAGCGAPAHVSYSAPPQSSQTWAQVFATPGDIQVTTLQTGVFHVPDKDHFLDGEEEIVATYRQESDELPVFVHLIEHPELGKYLVDAGFGVSPHDHLGSVMNWLLRSKGRWFDVPEGQDLVAKLGSKWDQITAVFLTHLHFDHVSGVRDLPAETRIVVGPYPPSFPTRVAMGNYLDERVVEVIDFSKAQLMEPFGKAVDLLGDGSLWAIRTTGHTLGHVSFLVNGREPALLTGDVVHFQWGFDNNVASISAGGDAVAQRESLDQIQAFSNQFPHVRIVFGHELDNPAAIQ